MVYLQTASLQVTSSLIFRVTTIQYPTEAPCKLYVARPVVIIMTIIILAILELEQL